MESSRFILTLAVFFISFHGIFLIDIPPSISKGDILTDNNQRKLEENSDNYIILHFNYHSEFTKGFKNEYRNVSLIKYMFKEYAPTDELFLAKGDKIEIHFAEPIETFEHFFDASYDKNMEFVEIIDFNYFDSSSLNNMNYLFAGCKSLKSIEFGDFTTKKVTTMNSVFLNCNSLTILDLSFFETKYVQDTSSMFKNCTSLTSLDLSNFELLELYKSDSMFDDLDNLFFVKLNNVNDRGMIEEKLSYKIGLLVCKNGYTNPSDSFIYCCDYSYEGKLCLEKKNYITIYYNSLVDYSKGFVNNFSEGINFIYNEYDNSTVRVKDLKYIYENSKIEIHFHYPITSLRKFFCKEQKTFRVYEMYYFIREVVYERTGSDEVIDQNMENLAYVDFTHFDSSAVTSMESLFEGCTF